MEQFDIEHYSMSTYAGVTVRFFWPTLYQEQKVDFSTVSLKVSPISQWWVTELVQEVRIRVGIRV